MKNKRIFQGIVVSDKMDKTIVVKVNRKVKHSIYEKYITVSKKYQAHDENNSAHIGDKVEIIESRPISKNKKWALKSIIEQVVA